MWDSQSTLTGLEVVWDGRKKQKWMENERVESSLLCESPVFERAYNWRARQKGCSDGGELVGLSSLLIWFGDGPVWERGKETQTWKERETERWRGKYVMWQMHTDRKNKTCWWSTSFPPRLEVSTPKSVIFRLSANEIQAPFFFVFVSAVIMSAKPCQYMHNRLSAMLTGCEILWMKALDRKRRVAVSDKYLDGLRVSMSACTAVAARCRL